MTAVTNAGVLLAERRFVAAYRTGDRLAGALAVGMPPKAIRLWWQDIAAGAKWHAVVGSATPATGAELREVVHGGSTV